MANFHARKQDTPKAVGEKLAAAKKVGVYSVSGQVVRLSDPQVRDGFEKRKKQLARDPKAARALLEDLGYLTPTGKVSARYA